MRVHRLIPLVLASAAMCFSGLSAAGAQTAESDCPTPPPGMNVIVSNAARIDGTRGADFICAGPGDNVIVTGGGNDIIHAGGGNDLVRSQGGADQIFGGEGDDILNSGKGNDLVEGGPGNDRINGGDNRDQLHGEDGNDRIVGGSGNDTMTGGSGNDAMHGGFGKDTMTGDEGRDRMSGNSGHDTIQGGADTDTINGGSGQDACLGGEGVLRNCEESPDADGDGFMQHEDCNDNDPAVHEATDEIFGDGIDQDCDGEDGNSRPKAVDSAFTIDENLPAGTIVGTVEIIDDDPADELTFSIPFGNTGDVFSIDEDGQITSETLDHEEIPFYTLAVVVTDRGGLTNVAVVEVSVGDVNEAVSVEDSSFTIAENNPAQAVVGVINATDIDDDPSLTFTITSGDDGGLFTIGANGLLVASPLDHEMAGVHTLAVTVSDGELTADATVVVTVTDVNEAPFGADGVGSIAENISVDTVVGVLTVSDPDGDSLTISVVGNPAGFIVVGDQLVATAALDFESTPVVNLELQVTDPGGLSGTFTFTLTVTDVNDAPIIDATQPTFSVAEDAADGASVGVVLGSDPDAGDAPTWTISNGPRFLLIDATSGELTITDSTLISDGEVYQADVTLTDAGALSDTASISVDITAAP